MWIAVSQGEQPVLKSGTPSQRHLTMTPASIEAFLTSSQWVCFDEEEVSAPPHRHRSERVFLVKEYCSTAARLSLTRVQPVEYALQLFKLLPSLAELAFRRQTLVVGKVFGGFRDECV
jgi:hypothetical protein